VCGIAGIWRPRPAPGDGAIVRRMLEPLGRRGPDDDGLIADAELTLGHTRLAILGPGPSGAQPMASRDGRFVTSYNGEIYNFEELRDELGIARETLRSRTDVEILLEAWARRGEACLDDLVGPFAFAIWDRETRALTLVRDRFGEKPLFWHRASDGTLTFASSLAALLRAPWVPRELDERALVEYLTLRYVVAPRTILAGVRKLAFGSVLRADEDGVRERRWWAPRFAHRRVGLERRPDAELLDEFDELLRRAARRCLVSDVPVALLLSEGIDSRSLDHVLREHGAAVPRVTYEPRYEPGANVPTRVEAVHHGARHVLVRTTTARSMDELPRALASSTEPVGDGAALATWTMLRAVRDEATVFVAGHGGDEILGGYRLSQDRFRLAALRRLSKVPLPLADPILAHWSYGADAPADRRRALARAKAGEAPAAARYLMQRAVPVEDVHALFGRDELPEPYLATIDALYADAPPGGCDLDGMQEVLIATFLSDGVLRWADSVSMDASAELRLPYLDRDLVDFVLRLPARWRVGGWPGRANTKQILRRWARGRLPESVRRGRKEHFHYGSLRDLLRDDRARLTEMVLGAEPLRRRLPGLEDWLAQDAEAFHGPREGSLWAVVALAAWCEANEVAG
jgi:asparagine synthase (glutamine-hydrolysing)